MARLKMPRPFKTAKASGLLFTSIVFVAVDLARNFILLMVYLRSFGASQLATVIRTVIANLAINASVFRFQLGSFAGRQLATLDALRNTILLIFCALSYFTCRVRILRSRIMLVLVDLV
jgi:hypothetical protein